MLVNDLMSPEPVTTRPESTIKHALQQLDQARVTSLPVVTSSGRIVGVVSEADLIRDQVGPDFRRVRVLPTPTFEGGVPRPRYVGDVMTAHPVTVRPETDVAAAVDLMTSTTAKSLPVVDDGGRVVGMLSRRDVVHALARDDVEIEGDVDAHLVAIGIHDWLVDVHDGVAEIDGPADRQERAVAEFLAGEVPGVIEVRFR